MAASILANSKMVWSQERANGKRAWNRQEHHRILTKENTLMIKKTDTGNLFGLVATNIRESIEMMKEKVMERWLGLMEVST
jgi:hypothetical protein